MARVSTTLKRERVAVQPGGDARWLCSKARRRCELDKHGALVREVSSPAALKGEGATSGGSGGSSPTLPTLATLAPGPTVLATSTPVQPMGIVSRWASAGDEHLPTASILVADNSLGLVAAEVVDEAVVAQACQLYGVALPCISSWRPDSSAPRQSGAVGLSTWTPVDAPFVEDPPLVAQQLYSSAPFVEDPPLVLAQQPPLVCASGMRIPELAVAQQLIPSSLQEIFTMHVMCASRPEPRLTLNLSRTLSLTPSLTLSLTLSLTRCDFTPRPPKDFPTSRWVTLEQLVIQLQQHAPAEVARIGPQNLRQLITEWYKGHPTFAGLAYSAWGKRLKDMHPQAHPRSLTYKFSFEHTPGGAGL